MDRYATGDETAFDDLYEALVRRRFAHFVRKVRAKAE